jgi:deoxyribonuclease-4
MLQIGCHLSSSKGFLNMGKEIVKLGGNTFQFFTRNPRGGAAKPIDEKDIEAFKTFAKENNINIILAHAPYTLNACSADADVRNFAKQVFADDLKRMEYIPGNMYNFHPGSHVKQGVDTGIEYIAQMLNEVLDKNQHTKVLLETMAGKGTEIGRSFEELQMIIEKVELNNKLGICLDTCHIYDAQYNIVDNLNGVIDELDKVIGLDRLCAIHLNDSKNPFASHKDRHELIGKGYIGIDTFNNIVSNEKLRNIPMYLETPNDMEGYAKEIAMLKQMYAKAH